MPLFGKKKQKSTGILKTYEKVIKDGFVAMKRGDDEKAQILFRKVLRWVTEDLDKVVKLGEKEKKELSNLLTKTGEAMLRLKDYDYAIKTLERAKTVDPKNFKAWMAIGKDLLQRNTQIPYALVCLREAAKISPENVEVHLLLGDAYRIQGQLDKALAAYQRALKAEPNNQDVIEKVLKIQPENIEILERYAKILEEKGDKKDLLTVYNKLVVLTGNEEYLEKGLALDPENKNLLITKARNLIKNDNYDGAKEVAQKLKEKYPEDPDVQMLYDELIPQETASVGEVEEEVKPIEINEVFGDLTFGEEEVKEEIPEKLEEEKKPVEEEVKIEEAPPRTPVEEFTEELENGNYDRAKEILESMNDNEISSLTNKDTKTLKFILDFLMDKEKWNVAENFINEIVSREGNEENLLLQSNILIEENKIDKAEKILNSLVQKNFKNGKALYLKAKIMALRDNEMGCRNFLSMATKFFPEVKKEIASDKYFERYRDKDWLKKLTS